MKKLLGLVIALCLIATTAIGYPMAYFDVGNGSAVEAASNYSKGYYKVTPSEGLNLRAKAGTSYKALALIKQGTRLKVTKIKRGWGYTSYSGKKGWVLLKYTKFLGRYLAGRYKVTADVGLCLRKGTSTSTKKLKLIPYKTVITVKKFKGDWGYTSYDGKKGWVAMGYVKLTSAPDTSESQQSQQQKPPAQTVTKYRVIADVGLCLRKGPGTSYKKLTVIPYKKVITLNKISGKWGRTKYDGKTGWVMRKYLKKISSSEQTGPKVVITKRKMLTRKRVCIGWKKLQKATKYAVYRSEKANKGYKLLFVTTRNYITNGKLPKNQYYYYKVRAYAGKKKYGEISNPIQIYTGAGYAGIRSATRISYKKAEIVWNEEQFAHGYLLFRSSGKKFHRIAVIRDATVSSYVDKGLDSKEKYSYKIRAFRKINGKYYYSDFSKVCTAGIFQGPSKITISKATKPKALKVSQTFTLKGKIHSEYDLTKVAVGICTEKGKWIKGMYAVRKPGKTTFNIHSVDALIKFDQLKKGTYRYRVRAMDSHGHAKNLINCKFTVTAAKFIWPCGDRSCITSYFGYRPEFGDYHPAIDIARPKGTYIHASRGGTVIVAQNNQYASSYGKYVIIEHSNGYQTLYAHSCKLKCEVGDKVSKGDVIALVGSTGNSTGPHCHFEIRYNGVKQNPLNYLP